MKTIHKKEYRALLEALVQTRKNQGFTQTQLARILKKPQSYISKLENGERRMDVIEFLEICKAVNADYTALLTRLGWK